MKLLNFKGKKGITLIALVITIIVLLILAGVTIAMVVGDNGILKRSNEAKETSKESEIEEELRLAISAVQIDYKASDYVGSFRDYLFDEDYGQIKLNIELDPDATFDTENYIITYKGYDFQIADDGSILGRTKSSESSNQSGGGSSGGGSSSAMIESQYGNLATQEEMEACESLFTYTYDDTNKTATATGLNFDNILEPGRTTIQSAQEAQEVATKLRKLVVPYQVEHNNETYSVTGLKYPSIPYDSELEMSRWAPWSIYGYGDFEYVPNLSAGSAYTQKNGATSSDESSLIIPASVTTLVASDYETNQDLKSLPRTNVIFASQSSITNLNRFFDSIHRVEYVTLPNSLLSIGNNDFSGCADLKSISIPSGVTSIGDSAFISCHHLTSINIPLSVTSIGTNAFQDCISLTSISIPSSVTTIDSCAFSGCFCLTSINIPSSVTSIGELAFSSCESLTSINIPSSVITIGNGAFGDIETVYVENEAVATLVENSGYYGTIEVDPSKF